MMTPSTGSNDAMEADKVLSSEESTGKYGGKSRNSKGGKNVEGKTKDNKSFAEDVLRREERRQAEGHRDMPHLR